MSLRGGGWLCDAMKITLPCLDELMLRLILHVLIKEQKALSSHVVLSNLDNYWGKCRMSQSADLQLLAATTAASTEIKRQ